MGYTIYITRKNNWFDKEPVINEAEWTDVVKKHPDLLAESGSVKFKGVETPVFSLKNPTGGSAGSFYFYQGNVHIDHADKEAIEKIKEIAGKLSAKVQGDELEVY